MNKSNTLLLIIEDDESDRYTYKRLLRSAEYNIVEVETLHEARQRCKDATPDCIILDFNLPDGSGLNFIKELTSETNIPGSSIIMMTGQGDEKIAVAAMKLGASDYIVKDEISEEKLLLAVKRSLESSALKYQLSNKRKEISYIATHDALTGVYTRQAFQELVTREISGAKRHNRSLAMFFIDLDKFKQINDCLGHSSGDKVLVEVSKRLKDNLRNEDFISRLGGDEFAVLIQDVSDDIKIGILAKKILHILGQPYDIPSKFSKINASIGIATFPLAANNYENLIHCADIAMYRAKEMGGNTYQFFSKELNAKHQEKVMLENTIRDAMDRNLFHILYQPQFETSSREIFGVEALLRLTHPEFGIITPDQFIPIAEDTGLIRELGEWVLVNACTEFTKWSNEKDIHLRLSVNVSPQNLHDSEYISLIKDLIKKKHIISGYLDLEITETTLMHITPETISLLNEIRAMGVSISIDDFGTGYSSLAYLAKLPIDNIKIDKSFICNLTQETYSAKIVESIIGLGKHFNKSVIAEGVETEEHLKFLHDNQCFYSQGFLFSKPTTLEKIEKLIKKH